MKLFDLNARKKIQPICRTSEISNTPHTKRGVFTGLTAIFLIALYGLTSTVLHAQAPVVTKNIGMPTGNASCAGVAFGNSVYVAVLNGGFIYKSPDGNAWTKVQDAGIPAVGTFTSVAFGAGNFVVSGNNGLILTSSNGQNWTSRTSATTNNLLNVQFLQGAFYVVGNNATLRRSTDAVTWSSITIGTGNATDFFMSITYGNNIFAITSRSSTTGSSYVYKSATGLSSSWSFVTINPATLLNRVQYLNDRFYAFFAGNYVYTSTNASTWTDVTATITLSLPNSTTGVWNSSNQIFNGFYDGTKYYYFGSSEYYSGYGSVWTATTGLNLTLQTKSAYIVPQGSAFLNGKYFQWGNEGIVSSTNGTVYKYPSGSYNALASSGTGYVGVGYVGTSGVIYTSPDFNTWTEKTPAAQKELYGVAFNGTKYLAAGNKTVVESTDNGATWSQIATPADVFNSLDWGSSKFVAAGYNNAYAGKIAYSATGVTWTTCNTADNYYFKVKYVNGHFFAMGYSNASYLGVIMHSTDGITWTNITPTLSFPVYYFNDVVYDGSKYHFMGMEYAEIVNYTYKEFFSVSTATVTNTSSFGNKGTITTPHSGIQLGGTWGESAFAYTNGHFGGIVSDIANGAAYAVYSVDGISWNSQTLDENTYIFGAIADGNKVRLIGTGDGKITLDFAGTLAVNQLDFTASPVKEQALLKWRTASEQNSHHFTIEHSIDNSNWIAIGTKAAAGNSAVASNYSFVHNSPAMGVNYYRLLQTDLNGKTSFSEVRLVKFNASIAPFTVIGNPVNNGFLQLKINKTVTLSLSGIDGHQLWFRTFTPGIKRIDINGYAKGIYLLSGDNTSQKVVVQ